VASISNWLRSVEEADGVPGDNYIPEDRRAFLTSGDIDLYHRGQICIARKGEALPARTWCFTKKLWSGEAP
jgi:hypothetical protein